MNSKLKVACVQINSTNNFSHNLDHAIKLGNIASDRGADFITYPENVLYMAKNSRDLINFSVKESENIGLKEFSKLSMKINKWILVGSIPIPQKKGKLLNRSFLIDPKGKVAARYDKIHLFDAMLSSGKKFYESKTYSSGTKAVIYDSSIAKIGLTICFDIRFPHLYRDLAKNGAQIITVPSAFTKETGEKHWHILLRSRAIETGAFIVAPAQTGYHSNGRETYGHSLIISPSGKIISEMGIEPGVIVSEINLSLVEKAREEIPVLNLNKVYET